MFLKLEMFQAYPHRYHILLEFWAGVEFPCQVMLRRWRMEGRDWARSGQYWGIEGKCNLNWSRIGMEGARCMAAFGFCRVHHSKIHTNSTTRFYKPAICRFQVLEAHISCIGWRWNKTIQFFKILISKLCFHSPVPYKPTKNNMHWNRICDTTFYSQQM